MLYNIYYTSSRVTTSKYLSRGDRKALAPLPPNIVEHKTQPQHWENTKINDFNLNTLPPNIWVGTKILGDSTLPFSSNYNTIWLQIDNKCNAAVINCKIIQLFHKGSFMTEWTPWKITFGTKYLTKFSFVPRQSILLWTKLCKLSLSTRPRTVSYPRFSNFLLACAFFVTEAFLRLVRDSIEHWKMLSCSLWYKCI